MFNIAAHFMATNPLIKLMEPVLALGFIIHIIWSGWITIENMRARPTKYAGGDKLISWYAPSKNMFILGGLVLAFLVLHISNFWWKMKVTGAPLLAETHVDVAGVATEMENAYALVSSLFINSMFHNIVYIIGSIFLGLHLSHGFWSAFQTIGLNNDIWVKRLKCLANLFAIVLALGFAYIPIYFMIKF
jgi:succinate dehydrogenase / fumarate reductase cytochrome b subunit